MSCGVDLCPAGTVGGVTMRGGGACPAGQMRMLGTYADVIRDTPGPMDGWGTMKGGNRLRGGGCGCMMRRQAGGACPCMNKMLGTIRGGYRATQRNRKYLKLWRKGKSIGFTMRSSLKAKGLIPRANGTYKVSKKYRG